MTATPNRSPNNMSEDQARRRLVWIVLGCGLAAIGALFVLFISQPASIEGLTIFSRQARGHDDTLVLQPGDLPPVGGMHHDQWQNCGFYLEPIEAEKAIHSMEHGAVWITYRPDIDRDELTLLQSIVRDQEYLLLSPYPGQRSPVVLSAWSVQLQLDSANDNRLPAFINRYRLGPTTPERGAACSVSYGEPEP